MLLLAPCFPWVGFIVCLCAPLLFSVWLPSALWVSFSWHLSLPCLVGLFATVSSFGFSFVVVARCVLCTSLALVFHFVVLGSPPVAWWPSVFFWPCSLLFSGSDVPFLLSRVFSSSCLGFSVGLPWVFLCVPLLSFLPLGSS